MSQDFRLERLLGRPLADANGRPFGLIEDVVVEPEGDDYVVTHVVVGPHTPFARILAFAHQIPVLTSLGLGRPARVRHLPWSWLDLADPEHPRLLRSVID